MRSEVRHWFRRRLLSVVATAAIVSACFAQAQGPVRLSLDEAIEKALQHNHNLLAARTTIQQSEASETTANLRPNPTLFGDWEYLPLTSANQNSEYLQNSTEADIGPVSYTHLTLPTKRIV